MTLNDDQMRRAGGLKNAGILLIVLAVGLGVLTSRTSGAVAGLLDVARGLALLAGLPLALIGWSRGRAARKAQQPPGG